jgi:CheY-like chemotaxis protein
MITLQCRGCGGIVTIEFDPRDDRTLRGRILVIRPPFGRREIVLVDDDPEFLQTLGALLRHEGYSVVAEATVFSAFRYLRHHVADILITDGRVGGWEPANYAKRRRLKMPVVIVTGFASGRDQEDDRWGLPVFVKPFERDFPRTIRLPSPDSQVVASVFDVCPTCSRRYLPRERTSLDCHIPGHDDLTLWDANRRRARLPYHSRKPVDDLLPTDDRLVVRRHENRVSDVEPHVT